MQSNGARALLAIAALAIVIVGFVALQGEDEAGESSATPTTTTEATGTDPATTEMPEKPEKPELTTIVVKSGETEGGVAELEYKAGDRVRFAVESDTPDEIHVHGYDLYEDVEPGKPAKFDFAADLDGIYEVELHGTATQIAELVIEP